MVACGTERFKAKGVRSSLGCLSSCSSLGRVLPFPHGNGGPSWTVFGTVGPCPQNTIEWSKGGRPDLAGQSEFFCMGI